MTLFMCYGNELMGNDAFGLAVHDALPQALTKIYSHQLLPEMLEEACKYDRLVFVDASDGVGDVAMCEIFPSEMDTSSFHHLTPQTFLKLLETLYAKIPIAYLCTAFFDNFELGTKDADFDEKVSEAVELILG